MSEQFVIEGGRKLSGTVRPSGNKNEALPVLCATLLTDQPVVLHNVPRIRDVNVLLDILRSLGGTVEELGSPNSLRITNATLASREPAGALCRELRASILLAGPMTARAGGLVLPPPGGDVIGRRRVDTHFAGLQALGAHFELDSAGYLLSAPSGLIGADFFMDEASVTATENLVMAASLARGTTVFRNVACEPHVQRLCHMLNAMGAQISGVGSNTLTIEGAATLGGCEHTIGPDYLEVGSFIGLAACTGSEFTIQDAGIADLRMILMTFDKLGIRVEKQGDDLLIPGDQSAVIKKDLQGHIPRIDDAIWPAFPTDLMSIAIVTATQCHGTVLFFEKMYEGRMFFTDRLIGMGASIILCDPHRVVVVGPSQLYGSRVESPDVRAGMALLIAALCAKGTTTIGNIRQIDRGYERIEEKLRGLGASIKRQAE